MDWRIIRLFIVLTVYGTSEANNCLPRCVSFEEINTLWGNEDPERYWQCDPIDEDVWIPVLRICAPATLFSFRQQTCVDPDDWEEVCVPQGGDSDENDPGVTDPNNSTPDETDPGDKDPGDSNPDDEDPGDKDSEDEDHVDSNPDDDKDPGDKDPGDEDPDDPESDETISDPCVPRCVTFKEINTLWANEDPERYWQCDPIDEGVWIPVLRICAPATLFSFRQQTCVDPNDWEEVCIPKGEDSDENGPGVTDPDDTDPELTDPNNSDPDDKDPGDSNPDDEDPGDKDSEDDDHDDSNPDDDKDPGDKDPGDEDSNEDDPDNPGSDETISDPCVPRCVTFKEINTLWANEDPERYWQCDPVDEGVWVPVLRICAPATLFSFRQQTCVDPNDWEEVCILKGEDSDENEPGVTDPGDTDPGVTDPDNSTPDETDPGDKDPGDSNPDDEDPGDKDSEGDDHDDSNPDDDKDPGDEDSNENDPNDPESDETISDPCVPRCETFKEINTLWANEDPERYWQCDPIDEGVWIPVLRICAPTTLFSFRQQTCVDPNDWEEVCVPQDDDRPPGGGDDDSDENEPGVTDPNNSDPDETDPGDKDPGDSNPDDEDPGDKDSEDDDHVDSNPDDDKDPGDDDPNDPDDPESDETISEPCVPRCETFEEINTLWAHEDPERYWQCDPIDEGVWIPVLRVCAPTTLYSFRQQTCVDPSDWEEICVSQARMGIRKLLQLSAYPKKKDPVHSSTICPTPSCLTFTHVKTLWADSDPNFFLECRSSRDSNTWGLRKTPCAPGTWFNYHLQACVFPEDWKACVGQQTSKPAVNPPHSTVIDGDYFARMANERLDSDKVICGVPRCRTQSQISRVLWPGSAGDSFYQCVPDGSLVAKTVGWRCPVEMLFDWKLQRCVRWTRGVASCLVKPTIE
ncbi:uncharacterized protein LOC131683377 [Topomyia yanbarensis]|uniref:uncharacterized protein LOC131683377 n=1 Tax=Topomyia yanbarensis TaxID=2498891 RepID=UPI00273AB2C2|nr:uncharacterized protein LOC131683377 [Topomyia yanbarensis]